MHSLDSSSVPCPIYSQRAACSGREGFAVTPASIHHSTLDQKMVHLNVLCQSVWKELSHKIQFNHISYIWSILAMSSIQDVVQQIWISFFLFSALSFSARGSELHSLSIFYMISTFYERSVICSSACIFFFNYILIKCQLSRIFLLSRYLRLRTVFSKN